MSQFLTQVQALQLNERIAINGEYRGMLIEAVLHLLEAEDDLEDHVIALGELVETLASDPRENINKELINDQ